VPHYNVTESKCTGLKVLEYGNDGIIWGWNPTVVEEFKKG
jgi:hypothetical protein